MIENTQGLDANRLATFHGYTDELPIRYITKLDIVGIYNHQPLTIDGK